MFYRRPKQLPKNHAGADAEAAAAQWLQTRELVFIERNFRCRGGEIDLIMRDRHMLVFVEVRLRSRTRFGSGSESVTTTKQRRIVQAARYYLNMHPAYSDLACRFDVLAATSSDDGALAWEWVRDAFYAG